MKILDKLRSLAESGPTFPPHVVAIENALNRFFPNRKKEVRDKVGAFISVDYYDAEGNAVAGFTYYSRTGDSMEVEIAGEEPPDPSFKWECGFGRGMESKDRLFIPVCQTRVDPSNYKDFIKKLPRIIKKALDYVNRKRKEFRNTRDHMKSLVEKTKRYINSVLTGDLYLEVLDTAFPRFYIKDRSSKYLSEVMEITVDPEGFVDIIFKRPNKAPFDVNPLKRGAKKVVRKFPRIREIKYKKPVHPEVTITWDDTSNMADDLIGVLEEVRKK